MDLQKLLGEVTGVGGGSPLSETARTVTEMSMSEDSFAGSRKGWKEEPEK